MTTPADPVDGVKTALTGTGDDLIELGLYGLGIGVGLVVLRKGWQAARKFF